MPMSIPRFKGLGMGRKLSLTNLTKAVSSTSSEEKEDTKLTHEGKGTNIRTSLLLSPNTALPKNSDRSTTSSGLATAATTPARSPLISAYTQGASPAPTMSLSPLLSQPSLIPPTAQTQAPQASTATAETTATLLGSPFASSTSISSLLRDLGGDCADGLGSSQPEAQQNGDFRPLSMCSIGTLATTTSTADANGASSKKSYRLRSKATEILLNLDSSSNDARFQEILHNTIALDHFRQFCFQEYSIENLLFWLDVELFSKPPKEFLDMDTSEGKSDEILSSTNTNSAGRFAVKHARYIYLTYIDSHGPLQVNLSDETRTEIPWPILDYSPSSSPTSLSSKESELEGWPVDRRMFDAAQEHTYQLMKGHTLVRFEESDLWKEVETIICEQPEEYAKAAIHGPLNGHYKPDVRVITNTVFRSRSRHPSAKLQTLYNWNNSTSDLDRSRDKEEALAKTMSQYFGPIPASIRHPARIILGLGGSGTSGQEDEDDDYYYEHSSIGAEPGCEGGLTSKAGKRISAGLRKARFSRLSVGKKRLSTGSNFSDDSNVSHHYHLDDELDDSVESGKRITRWMVAGYFNDQVRLTGAQRKRLLRRNNKLTKFFGSRVDGTLRPVEEITGEEGSSAGLSESGHPGSRSAPSLGSPLAYALSSSNIHDVDKKSSKKSIKASKKMNKKMFRHSEIDFGSKSTNLLQKFKKSHSAPLEYDPASVYRSNRSGGPLSPTMSTHQQHYHPLDSTSGLLQSLPLSPRQPKEARIRSVTVAIDPGHRFVAHPHPLWSGSLSDQEGSGAYERRRGLSILSLTGGGANTIYSSPKGQDVLDLALPSPTNIPSGGNILDRQAMLSRRKKADKLSTFFGATLTKQELASQLKMADEDDHLIEYGDGRISNDSRRSGIKDSSLEQARPGLSVATVNQLSHRERSILWKRNKKLRGLLGESLPESEVAHALTRPVLLLGSSRLTHPPPHYRQARRGSSVRSLRSKRRGSTASTRSGYRDRPSEYEDDSDTFEDEEDELNQATSSATKGQRGSPHAYYQGRIHKKRHSVSRPGSLSSSASYSMRESLRTSTSSEYPCSNPRPLSVDSSNSIFTSQTDTWLLSVNEKTHEVNEASGAVQHTRRSIASDESADLTGDDCPGARFNRKKKMDKIQQFLGDRVPEQDLWMGAVGRERTLQMMNLNLISTSTILGKSGRKSQSSNSPTLSNSSPMSPTSISPTTSIGPGFSPLLGTLGTLGTLGGSAMQSSNMESPPQSLSASVHATTTSLHTDDDSGSPSTSTGSGFFNKHGFPGRSKSKIQAPSKESGNEAAPVAGVRLERSLSDPPTPFFRGLKISSRPGTQRASEELPSCHESRHQKSAMSIVGRLRLQLAASRESSKDQGDEGLVLAPDMAISSKSACALSGDDEGDKSSALILPSLRAMSEEDQERFLKRAEKLEKMFGTIPPSALLESSLTTPPLSSGSSPSQSSSQQKQGDQPRSLMELAGLLAHTEAAKSHESSGGMKAKPDKRSSDETVESLGILET